MCSSVQMAERSILLVRLNYVQNNALQTNWWNKKCKKPNNRYHYRNWWYRYVFKCLFVFWVNYVLVFWFAKRVSDADVCASIVGPECDAKQVTQSFSHWFIANLVFESKIGENNVFCSFVSQTKQKNVWRKNWKLCLRSQFLVSRLDSSPSIADTDTVTTLQNSIHDLFSICFRLWSKSNRNSELSVGIHCETNSVCLSLYLPLLECFSHSVRSLEHCVHLSVTIRFAIIIWISN